MVPSGSVEPLLLKAKAQRGLGQLDADATLRQVLEIDPENAEAKRLLGG